MRYYRDKVPDIAIPLAVDEKLDPFAKNMPNNESSQQLGDEQQMRGREGYYAVIDFVDDCMGELLDGLEKFGALDNTIIIYSSDRGEIAGDHGLWAKGLYFKEEIRVPLLMWPGASSRAVTAWPIRVADGSLPHICLLAGLLRPGKSRRPRRCGCQRRPARPNLTWPAHVCPFGIRQLGCMYQRHLLCF